MSLLLALVVAACGKTEHPSHIEEDNPLTGLIEQATEQSVFYQVSISLSTPMRGGILHVYRLLDGNVLHMETRRFDTQSSSINIGYNAPASSDRSAVLLHMVGGGLTAGRPDEYVCFSEVDHKTTRHNFELACDLESTVTYYLAARSVGRSGHHPFHDIDRRLPHWSSLHDAHDNDVIGFYVSIFGTLQNALTGMGRDRFDPERHSIRPVMETIVARFVDSYQRNGQATAEDLVSITNAVTDHALPVERLTRYETIFDNYAHVQDVALKNTGGSLTRKTREIELLSMESELSRFYVHDSPFEMSDFRTHVVQNIRHFQTDTEIAVYWDPIPHMYGYNAYFNGAHVGYTRLPKLSLPPDANGTVTVKAVGYAGEFDGVHHDLAEPSLLAGVAVDAN